MDDRTKMFGAIALILVLGVGCFGPMQLSRQFDDWSNEFYTKEPWWGQLGIIVYPIVMSVLNVADFVVLNAVNFWSKKDYSGDGTPFRHKVVTPPAGKRPIP